MNFASIGSRVASPRRSSTEGARSLEAGFTLFETLIALMVVSIGLVSLFEAQSQALKTAGISADYVAARILAQNLLSETMGNPKPQDMTEGVSGAFRWSVNVNPETEDWAHIPARDDWKLFHVRVLVLMASGRKVEFNSLKLGRTNG